MTRPVLREREVPATATAMPRRLFLPWTQPLLTAVVDHLAACWESGPLDLADLAAIVPTAEAGRRLRESLALRAAARGTAVLSPHIITPELITSWTLAEMPSAASPADELLVWMQVLQELPLEEYATLFPVPPVSRDTAWARSTAGELLRLRHRLEEGGRTIAGAARRLGTGHPEAERWQDLTRLESRALTALKQYGRVDPVSARIAAAAQPVFPAGVKRIALLAVPDPVHLVITALENAERQGAAVDVLVHADESLAGTFDVWGRPLPDVWGERVIDIPHPSERMRLLPRPDDAAEVLVNALQRAATPGSLAIGSADPEVAIPLADCAARTGVPVFDPNGIPLGCHELTWMLTCLTGLLRGDSANEAARLLRLPNVLIAAPVNVTLCELLRDWDEFQQAHLPRTLRDALQLTEQWVPRRTDRADGAKPVLRPVLEWLQKECRAMRRADGMAAFYRFLEKFSAGKTFDTPEERELFAGALDQWQETLDAITRASARTGYRLDTTDTLDTALHLLRDARLYPDNTENARILNGWLELPWQDAPDLAIAGMNEGLAPDSITGDPWLPDSVRGALDLKTNAIRLARDSYLLTSMIECRRASGSVLLLAARETSSGDPLKPSRLLLRCPEAELPARALRLFPSEELEDVRPSPPAWHRAWTLRVPAPDPEAEIFKRMSVTQFIDYLNCPFRFYLKHVLRMEPFDATRDEMEARDFGSVIHDSIQRLHEHEALRDSDDEAALAGFLDEAVRNITAQRYGPDPALPLIIQLESARNRLRVLARIQASERAAGWRIEHVERSFPEELEGVQISGRIDLIERHQETGQRRVIDYKTGAKGTDPEKAHVRALRGSAREIPDWQQLDYAGKPHAWLNLQLPFYAWIVSRLGHEDVQAGYINLPVATSEAGLKIWEELDDALVRSAIDCARGVIRSIRQGIFWPPARSVEFDDFEPLWFQNIDESFDPVLLEKFRELRQA